MSYKRLRSQLRDNTENSFERMTSAFEAEGELTKKSFTPIINHPTSDYLSEIQHIKSIDAKLGITFERLNTHQRHAVFHPTKEAILSAMVGSGKTTVLIAKIFHLHFIQNIPFKDIVVLTFTNKAAREIKERIARFLGDNYDKEKDELRYVGTFHSIARQLLQEHTDITSLGFKPNFTIMDEQEKQEFLQRIIIQEDLNIKYQNKLSKRWRKHRQTGDTIMGNMKQEDDLVRLIDLAQKEKCRTNAMDFDDLITLNNQLLKQKQHKAPQWIIVDEFQDCNEEQLLFIDYLKGETTGLFVVGDQNQSIYAWRGSKEDVFEDIYRRWEATWMELPQNYRSTGHILSAAETLLQDNNSSLIATRDTGTPIDLVRHFDDQQEAFYLCQQIQELQQKELPIENYAILFRTHQQIPLVQTVLAKANIPHQLVKRVDIHNDVAQHYLLRLFKLSLNPNDVDAVLTIICDPTFGTLKKTKTLIKKLQKRDENTSAIQAATQHLSQSKKDYSFHIHLLKQTENLLAEFIDKAETNTTALIQFLGLTALLKPTSIHHQEYIDSITVAWKELSLYMAKQMNGTKSQVFHVAIDQVILESTFLINDRIKEVGNGIHLMTIHASKGLEFDKVFIVGANTGIIPLTQHQTGSQNLKEEKRLLFVAITRGKNSVEIGWHANPTTRNTNPSPSYFLNAIPDHLINHRSATDTTEEKEVSPAEEEWIIGVEIEHKKYGKGEITAITEKEITCTFPTLGEKAFAKNFAKALLKTP